jgi:hypothetical protein
MLFPFGVSWSYRGGAMLNFAITEFQEMRALLLDSLPDYGDWAMGVPDNRIRDTAHQSSP